MNKSQLREHAKNIRAAIPDEQRQSDAEKLKENVMTGLVPVIQNGGMDCMDKPCNDSGLIVGTYYPIGTEIIPPFVIPAKAGILKNRQDILDLVRNNSFVVALPVIREGKTLEFYPWSPNNRLVKREFDIPIPDTRNLSPVTPDILLLPLLLVDKKGNRIGYGAGHYDRYIASCDVKPKLIGLCFDEQVYDGDIPAEPHDQKLDLIITPRRVIDIP